MPFPKGVSGNPGGLSKAYRQVREAFLEAGPEALAKLLDLMRTSEDESVVRMAADSILDRGGLKGYCIEPERHAFTDADGKPVEAFRIVFVGAEETTPAQSTEDTE